MKYSELAGLYERLEETPSRLDKVSLIASFIEGLSDDDLRMSLYLLSGSVFPKWSEKEIGIASKTAAKIVSSTSGVPPEKVMKEYSEIGDLGSVAEKLLENRKQMTLFKKSLALRDVFENFRKLAVTEGIGSADRKAGLVSELVSSASPKEAKYIIRTITEELRIGVAEGIVRDSIAQAYFSGVDWLTNIAKKERIISILTSAENKNIILDEEAKKTLEKWLSEEQLCNFNEKNNVSVEDLNNFDENRLWKRKGKIDYIFTSDDKAGNKLLKKIVNYIEWAWFLKPDYSEVAVLAKNKGIEGLKKAEIELGKPIQVLLAEKSQGVEDALKEFENAAIEVKYDGMRTQIHKDGERVWLYTRRLENVTEMFPDLVELVKKQVKADKCVLEGETLGFDPKTGKAVPFQHLSRRIHRKYDIMKLAKDIPVRLYAFDVIYLDGKMLFDKPFRQRRKILEDILNPLKGKIEPAEELVTKDVKKANEFYQKALQMGQEGVMVKNLDSLYQPGKRVAGGWLKVKPIMETLDLVVTGAVWGTGKRAGWLGSFLLSCRDKEGNFLECGMMGTGIKEKKTDEDDVTFMDLTEMIKPDIIKEKDNTVQVRPKIILEIAYEEIQKSPNYDAKYALRFPRLVRIRYDRRPEECDSIERIESLYLKQRGRNI